MRNSPLGLVVAAIVCFPTLISQAAGPAPAALKTFLEREGFGGSPLQRRFGNHLFATTLINGRKTALMIDSGRLRCSTGQAHKSLGSRCKKRRSTSVA